MVELSVRLLVSGVLTFVCGWLAPDEFTFALGVAGVHAALAGLENRLSARGLMGSRVAEAFGLADAGLLAVLLARFAPTGLWTVALSPLPLLGPALAARLRGASSFAALGAPVASGAALLIERGPAYAATPIMAAAISALALILGGARTGIIPHAVAPTAHPTEDEEDGALFELRLAFRKLRDAYRELEKTSRRDRLLAGLGEAKAGGEGTLFSRVAERLRKLSGADGLTLYTVAGYDDLFVVRAAVGDLTPSQETGPLEISARSAAATVRESADVLLATLRDGAPGTNVPLVHDGRVVGVLAATATNPDAVPKIASVLESASAYVAALVHEGARRESVERRLKETELLYGLATGTDGAAGRADAAARAVRDLREILEADHVSVHLVEDGALTPLASEGVRAPILEGMSFAGGAGIAGWVATGAPEIAMSDVRGDGRCSAEAALRARIGAFVAVPLTILGEVGAVLCAATSRVGGLDLPQIETLRAAGAELARRLGRPAAESEAVRSEGDGLLLPSEFAARLLRGGALVTLDPIRLEVHEAAFGKPAVAHAMRTLSHRVRAKLPPGASACRTPDARLLVLMPEASESEAIAWGNEMAAVASLLGLRTPDGTRRIPIALRAKIALIESEPSSHERVAA